MAKYAEAATYWAVHEIEELGLDPKDGTMCKKKGCDCGATVDDAIKRRK